jgi:GNAT superfamily N-acetyltransferase
VYFDAAYVEEIVLRDGRRARVRLVRPEDKAMMTRGFELLSPQSRYLRFFTHKDALSDAELAYLTEMDQVSHFALGACTLDDNGDECDGLAVARFVRLPERPEVAESAVVVTDSAQNQGLGRLLFQRLVSAAVERGVGFFRAEVLADNDAMRALIGDWAPDTEPQVQGDVMVLEWPLPETPPDQPADAAPRHSPIYRMLVAAAKGLFQWKPSKS